MAYIEPNEFIIEPKFQKEEVSQLAKQKMRKGFLNVLGGTGEMLDVELHLLPMLEISTLHQKGLVFKKWEKNNFFFDPHVSIVHSYDLKNSAIPYNPKIKESLGAKLLRQPIEYYYKQTENAMIQQLFRKKLGSLTLQDLNKVKISIDSLIFYPFFVAHYQKKLIAFDGLSKEISDEHTAFFERALR